MVDRHIEKKTNNIKDEKVDSFELVKCKSDMMRTEYQKYAFEEYEFEKMLCFDVNNTELFMQGSRDDYI